MLKVIGEMKRKPDLRYCQVCGKQHDLSVPAYGNQEPYRWLGCTQCKKLADCFVCRGCDLICKNCSLPFVEKNVPNC